MSADFVLFCNIDSRVENWKGNTVRAEKKLSGMPSMVFLDSAGVVLTKVPFQQRTVEGLRAAGARAKRYLALRGADPRKDAASAARFLCMQLEERQVKLPEALERRARIELESADSAALRTTLDRKILHLRISTEVSAKGQKGRHELGSRFFTMWTEGPKPGPDVGRGYWYAMLEWAERERKPQQFSIILEGMRASLRVTDPDASWVPGLLGRYEKTLEKLRAQADRK